MYKPSKADLLICGGVLFLGYVLFVTPTRVIEGECLRLELNGNNSVVYVGQISCGDKDKNSVPDNTLINTGMDAGGLDDYLNKLAESVREIPTRENVLEEIKEGPKADNGG